MYLHATPGAPGAAWCAMVSQLRMRFSPRLHRCSTTGCWNWGKPAGRGSVKALLSHNQKLSDRLAKQTENMQAALTRLEKLERTKSDFISIAAHELKTPLTLVRGYGTILAEDIQGKEEQELVALATGIVQGTERLGQIIDDMIDVALLDLDTLDWRREIVYLDKLIDMAVTEVKATAPMNVG